MPGLSHPEKRSSLRRASYPQCPWRPGRPRSLAIAPLTLSTTNPASQGGPKASPALLSPAPLCCLPLPNLSAKRKSLQPDPSPKNREGKAGALWECLVLGPSRGAPSGEVNEQYLGYHDVLVLDCLQRQVVTTWSQAGARKGGSSTIRLRPEELEWAPSPRRPLPGLPLLQEQAPWAPWWAAALLHPSLCLGSLCVTPHPPSRGSLPWWGAHTSTAGRGLRGHLTHCPKFHSIRET